MNSEEDLQEGTAMACHEVRKWFTKEVLSPVNRLVTEAREVCEDIGEWVERETREPVESWVNREEEKCKRRPWWHPLRWFCWIVVTVVKVVTWVVTTVVEWVAKIVCQVVTFIVGTIVGYVLRVISWAVTFVVCVFTDPEAAFASFRDLWHIVTDFVEGAVGFIDLLLDDVVGILDDIIEFVDALASSLGWLGVALGLVSGLIKLIRNLVNDVRDILSGVKDLLIGILSLDPCRMLKGIADIGAGLGRVIVDTGGAAIVALFAPPVAIWLLGGRILGAMGGGVRDQVHRTRLEGLIREQINGRFGANSETADAAINKVKLGWPTMGAPFRADARRLYISSEDSRLSAQSLHDSGMIDLYKLAGYINDCNGGLNEPEGEVVYNGTELRVTYADLSHYLSNGPGSTAPFEVYPITRKRMQQHLEIAKRKARDIGVRLTYDRGRLQAINVAEVPLAATEQDGAEQEKLMGRLGRTGSNDDLSIIPSVAHFHYILDVTGRELFGLTSWWRPSSKASNRSGVTWRQRQPDLGFRWVLTHELGHYWGINHDARNGEDRGYSEIMFAPSSGGFSPGSDLLEYFLLGGEPRFTFDDARDTWDWILGDMINGASPSLFP